MKLKEWERMKTEQVFPNPIKGTPVRCPCCNHLIGYDKDFMFMVIPEPGIVCQVCDEIVIWSLKPSYKEYSTYIGDPPLDMIPKIESRLDFLYISLIGDIDGTSI